MHCKPIGSGCVTYTSDTALLIDLIIESTRGDLDRTHLKVKVLAPNVSLRHVKKCLTWLQHVLHI